jgi:hypothetical protein
MKNNGFTRLLSPGENCRALQPAVFLKASPVSYHEARVSYHAEKLVSRRLPQPLFQAAKTLADTSGDLSTNLMHQRHKGEPLVILNTRGREFADARSHAHGLESLLALTPRFDIILIMVPMVIGRLLLPFGGGAIMALALALGAAASFLPVAVTIVGQKAVFAERANFAVNTLLWHRAKSSLKFLPSVQLVFRGRTFSPMKDSKRISAKQAC